MNPNVVSKLLRDSLYVLNFFDCFAITLYGRQYTRTSAGSMIYGKKGGSTLIVESLQLNYTLEKLCTWQEEE